MGEVVHKIVSIAGSDSCGGAGIQVDIKTATSLNCHCCTVITVVTAQNTIEVKSIIELEETFINEQLDCVFSDIEIDVVKLGVLYSKKITSLVCNYIKKINEERKKKNKNKLLIVFDPVFVAGSGAMLIENQSYAKFTLDTVCPLCTIITPNFFELKLILKVLQHDVNFEEMNSVELSKILVNKLNIDACYIKSYNIEGKNASECANATAEENEHFAVDHLCIRKKVKKGETKAENENEKEKEKENETEKNENPDDNTNTLNNNLYLCDVYKLKTKRNHGTNIHGTGCTLSTSIACFLAKKYDILQACVKSKEYIYHCIKNGYDLGHKSMGLHNLKAAKELNNSKEVDVLKVASDI